MAAPPQVHQAEILQHACLTRGLARLPVQRKRPPVEPGGLPVAALPVIDVSEVGQRPGLAAPVVGRAV